MNVVKELEEISNLKEYGLSPNFIDMIVEDRNFKLGMEYVIQDLIELDKKNEKKSDIMGALLPEEISCLLFLYRQVKSKSNLSRISNRVNFISCKQ